MDVIKKVKTALNRYFHPDVLDLQDDDGIIGVVVSDRFRAMESLDRQTLIQDALRKSSPTLSRDDMRQVLAIAPMTPEEYFAYGPRKKVHRNGKRSHSANCSR